MKALAIVHLASAAGFVGCYFVQRRRRLPRWWEQLENGVTMTWLLSGAALAGLVLRS